MVDKSGPRVNLAGRTRAFSPSNMENPMLELWYQYHEPFIDDYSLSDIILGLSELVLTDSRDTVTHLEHHYLSLHPLLLLELEEAVDAFQNLLERTVILQPRPLFIIDPTLLFRSTLRCAGTFGELKDVWDLFSRRLYLAREWFDLRCFSSLDRGFVADAGIQEVSGTQVEPSQQTMLSATPSRVTVRGPNALMDCLGASSHRHDLLAMDCLAGDSPEIQVKHRPDSEATTIHSFSIRNSSRTLTPTPSIQNVSWDLSPLMVPLLQLSQGDRISCLSPKSEFQVSQEAGFMNCDGVAGIHDGGKGDSVSKLELDTVKTTRFFTASAPPLLDPGPPVLVLQQVGSSSEDFSRFIFASAETSNSNDDAVTRTHKSPWVYEAGSNTCPDNRLVPVRGRAKLITDNRMGKALGFLAGLQTSFAISLARAIAFSPPSLSFSPLQRFQLFPGYWASSLRSSALGFSTSSHPIFELQRHQSTSSYTKETDRRDLLCSHRGNPTNRLDLGGLFDGGEGVSVRKFHPQCGVAPETVYGHSETGLSVPLPFASFIAISELSIPFPQSIELLSWTRKSMHPELERIPNLSIQVTRVLTNAMGSDREPSLRSGALPDQRFPPEDPGPTPTTSVLNLSFGSDSHIRSAVHTFSSNPVLPLPTYFRPLEPPSNNNPMPGSSGWRYRPNSFDGYPGLSFNDGVGRKAERSYEAGMSVSEGQLVPPPPLLDPGPKSPYFSSFTAALPFVAPLDVFLPLDLGSHIAPLPRFVVDVLQPPIVSSFIVRAQGLIKLLRTDILKETESAGNWIRKKYEGLDGLGDDGDGYMVSKLRFGGLVVGERRVSSADCGLRASPLLSTLHRLLVPSLSPSHLSPNSPSSTLLYSNSLDSPATRPILGFLTSTSVDDVPKSPETSTMVIRARDLMSSHQLPLLDPGSSDTARPIFMLALLAYRGHTISRNASSSYNLVHVLRTPNFEGRALTAEWKGVVHEVLDGLYDGGDGHAVSKVQYRGSLIDERRPSLAYRGLQVSRFTPTLLRLPVPNSSFSSHSPTISSARVSLITTIQVLVASWSVFMGLVRVRLLVQSSDLNGSKNKDWKEGLAGVSMARVSRAFVVKSRRIYARGELLLTSPNNFQLDRFLDAPRSPHLDPGPMVSESQFALATFLYVLQLLVLFGATSYDRSQPQVTSYTRANLSNPLAYGARVANTINQILAEMRLILVRGHAEPYTEIRLAGAASTEGSQVVFRHPDVTRVQAHVTVQSHRPCLLNLRPNSSSQLVVRPSPMSFRLQVSPASSVPSPDNRLDLARGHVEPFPDNRLGYALTIMVRPGNLGTKQRERWMSNICPETGLSILLLNSRPRFCLHLQSRRLLGLNTMRPRQTSSNNGEKGATVKDQGLCDGGDRLSVRKTHSQGLIVKSPLFLLLRHPPLLDPGPLPSVYSLPLRSPVPPHSLGISLDISFASPTSWIPRTSDVPTPAVMVIGVLRSLAALLLVAREYAPFIRAGVDSKPAYALDERCSQRMDPASLRGSDGRLTQRLSVLLFHCLPHYYLSLNVAILPSLSFADALPRWPSASGLTKFVMDGGVSRSLDTSSSVVRAPPSPFLPCLSPLFGPEPNSPLPSDIAASTLLTTSIYVVEFLRMVDVLSSVICVRVWSHARGLHDLSKIHSNRGLGHGGLESKGMYSAGDGCKIYLCYIKRLVNGIWALPPNQLSIYAVLSRVGGATTYPSHFTPLLCRSGFSRTFLLGGKGGIGISPPFRGQRTNLWSLRKIDIQGGFSAVHGRDLLSGS